MFAREFDTFILTAFRPGRAAGYWRESFSPEDEQAEEECFASLTRHLLRTYAQTGKTFIIQNWEGDWALRGSFDPATKPTAAADAAMVRWLAARQRGVARARGELTPAGARVFHACEVNLVRQAQVQGAPSVTTEVLPQLSVDLVSYSAWDTKDSPAHFGEALAFIAKHKRPTEPFGEHGVYVGEFGLPESEATPQQVLERTTRSCSRWRSGSVARMPSTGSSTATSQPPRSPKVNADYKGFWLVRPDGTRSPVCQLFQ